MTASFSINTNSSVFFKSSVFSGQPGLAEDIFLTINNYVLIFNFFFNVRLDRDD